MSIEYLNGFLGGMVIGLAASFMLILSGKICGNSGIVHGALHVAKSREFWRLYYVGGLIIGVLLYVILVNREVSLHFLAPMPVLIIGGLLVGYGTRLGGGCTSGHGVCGIGRLSKRSMVATAVFMISAMITVFLYKMVSGA